MFIIDIVTRETEEILVVKQANALTRVCCPVFSRPGASGQPLNFDPNLVE